MNDAHEGEYLDEHYQLEFAELLPEHSTFIVGKRARVIEVNKKNLTPEERAQFDMSDEREWKSLCEDEQAVRVISAKEAAYIRATQPHRIIYMYGS